MHLHVFVYEGYAVSRKSRKHTKKLRMSGRRLNVLRKSVPPGLLQSNSPLLQGTITRALLPSTRH